MPAPQALAVPVHGVRRSLLTLIALVVALAFALFGGAGIAHAEGKVPDKPKGLIYASEGAEVSPPDVDAITSLMTGLNDAHEEKVGVLITDEDTDAQKLAAKAVKEWGLSKKGAVIVITTKDQDVGLAVGDELEDRVSQEDQDDVVNKVKEGIGEYADWASGIQSGATRLFLYIEDQGLGGGTDDHHESDGHNHEADDPAAEEVPAGEAPDDAYTDNTETDDKGFTISDTVKIVLGVVIAVLAGAVLFLLGRNNRRKVKSGQNERTADEKTEDDPKGGVGKG